MKDRWVREQHTCVLGHTWKCGYGVEKGGLFEHWWQRQDTCPACREAAYQKLVPPIYSKFFYLTDEHLTKVTGAAFSGLSVWKHLRFETLVDSRSRCELCRADDTPLQVDHIFPRSRFPSLALCLYNLQVLCKRCNVAKLDGLYGLDLFLRAAQKRWNRYEAEEPPVPMLTPDEIFSLYGKGSEQ